MASYFIRKNLLFNFITLLSFLIFIFFISHIFFGERSIWKIFLLNTEISKANKNYSILVEEKKNILSEIDLLRDSNLDSDYISEISHNLLGLIESDQIVINVSK